MQANAGTVRPAMPHTNTVVRFEILMCAPVSRLAGHPEILPAEAGRVDRLEAALELCLVDCRGRTRFRAERNLHTGCFRRLERGDIGRSVAVEYQQQ